MLRTLSFGSFFIIFLLLLATAALAQQNSTPPAPLNTTLPPTLTFATSTFCRPNFYGVNVPVSSCLNAWAKIPRTGAEIVFGSRGQRGIDVSIPLRYQSDDGGCAVELRARVRGTAVRADVATAVEVSDAVERVIEECVVRASTGGSTRGFSRFLFVFLGGAFFFFFFFFVFYLWVVKIFFGHGFLFYVGYML